MDESLPERSLPLKPENPERTFRLEVAFDGTEYNGWQRQANGLGVQEVVEEKLAKLFNLPSLRIQGSSRTDAGVHALGMTVSFRAPRSPFIPDWKVKRALNRLLPPSINVRSAAIEEDAFNARFSAKGKAYCYIINTGELTPFSGRWSHAASDIVNPEGMKEGASFYCGTHDFSAFTVELDPSKDHVRTIYRAEVRVFGPMICFYVIGNGFLYKMVRSMAGMLIDIGRGKIAPDAVWKALESRNRRDARDVAPAKGLFLLKVFYREDEWKSHSLDALPFHLL